MNKTLLFFLFLFTCVGTFAQDKLYVTTEAKTDSVAYYMINDHAMAYSENDAKFLRLIIKADSGMFRIEDYYMDAKPRTLAYSFSNKMDFESGTQGKRIDYYPTGNIKTVSYYNRGKIVGDKELYYPNGNLYAVITPGDGIGYLKTCVDSTGTVLTSEGNGKWIDYDNFFENKIEGAVIGGKREGEWVETTRRGEKNTGVYKDGRLVSGALLTNDTTIYQGNADVIPSFAGGQAGLEKFLRRNFRYPVNARNNNIQGKVVVAFVVEKDGSLTHLRIVRQLGSGCDEEAVRVIKLSPPWSPAYMNGKAVRMQCSLPINFSLGKDEFKPITSF